MPAVGRWERGAFLRQLKDQHAAGNSLIVQSHREGAGGLSLCAARASLMDAILKQVWEHAVRAEAPSAGGEGPSCALLAIGGYGRAELSPASDIDLLFVLPKRSAGVSRFVRAVLYLLWDAGLIIGHSARTIAECLRIARDDYQSETSMLEHRLVAGSEAVHADFSRRFASHLERVGKTSHLKRRLVERTERYRSWDPSVYVQEPNVKENAGGLRDFHAVLWLSRVFGAKGFGELRERGWIPEEECRSARDAYDFLLRLRAQLHIQAGSKNDMLTFAAQTEAAPALGYEDTESAMAGESLMRDYFMRARALHTFCRDFFEVLEEQIRQRRWVNRRPRIEPIEGGLALQEYHTLVLQNGGKDVLARPQGLMGVFEAQYRFGCRLSPELRAFVRRNLDTVDERFRTSPEVRESFFRILDGKAGVARVVHEMHALGFLGRYIPEFEPLTCFVQYDHYHRYTADEHTLLTLANLDGLAYTKELPLQNLAHIHREMERTHILRLALLFHDIGKARGPRHVHKSAAALPEIIPRLGIPADEGRVIEFLVVNHMEMCYTAERRDIEDPALIQRFAEKMGTVEQLRMLYLLTYADVSSVAPGIWNEWRGTLHHDLYRKTLRLLESGEELHRKRQADEVGEQVVLEARAAAIRVAPAVIRQHVEGMPERYRAGTPPQEILRHIQLAQRLGSEAVSCVVDVTHRRRLGNTLLTIVCRDRLGLFAMIAGTLAGFDLSILDAKVYTRADGLVVDSFQVVDAEGKVVADPALWQRFGEVMDDLLAGRTTLDEVLDKNRRFLRLKQRVHFDLPTVVGFDLMASEDATVLEVITPDRHGLLARIARLLAAEGVSISRAKISTEGPRAVDAFYVTDAEGRKVEDTERLRELCDLLTSLLSEDRSRAAVA
ncbi:MAG: [protein-PII] uridylyltransferase [Candidatus Tectomicrobia bacterium]|uniref:Bifunctional uridylyltransferase/uridylyl-removing enzyme n=1 Tax=Tectimicrobiota bacterium TaxID=2528274 RepID=A0A932MPD3_UNCTE|nr:[protein-PII] uridylyltransferase [Candidatus Tectomicrobia bacterium]